MAITVFHPLGQSWVGTMAQDDRNLWTTLGIGNPSPTLRMAELIVTHSSNRLLAISKARNDHLNRIENTVPGSPRHQHIPYHYRLKR